MSTYIQINGGVPKIGSTFLGVPIIGVIIFWGLSWGPLIFGKLPNMCKWVLPCPLTKYGWLSQSLFGYPKY